MKRPVITLLTDFGLADHYVAAMKGVILSICPQAELIDISNEITPYSIPQAAYTLSQAWQYFPKGTTHLAVVDPGVGSGRRPLIAEIGSHRFVAPDNGLLTMVLASGPYKLREINVVREPASATFHGRDVFAPAAAHLAKGISPAKLGSIIDNPVLGLFSKPTRIGENRWLGTVLSIDRFGNIITNLDWHTFHDIARRRFRLKLGRRNIASYHSTYAEAKPGELFAIRGSAGYLEVSLNQSNAGVALRVLPGASLQLEWSKQNSTGIRSAVPLMTGHDR